MVKTGKPTGESTGRISPWQYAGLMLSYWCSARCAFCYVSCDPDHRFWLHPERIIDWWKQLESLAAGQGQSVKIHLTGGEAFGNWDLLVDILTRANRAGLTGLEKIETNAYWALDESIVRERLTTLKQLGVSLITTDSDVFHQEFVPIQNVQRLVQAGQEILGPEGVRVRWWDFYTFALENDLDIARLDEAERLAIQLDALENGRERLNGRAAMLASKLAAGKPAEAFAGENCVKGICKSKHVHIDPYGNIFPGTCCGIILGNAISEQIGEVYDWLNDKGPTGPVLETLVDKGPAGLIDLASRTSFKPLAGGYLSKCQLCYHLRWHLYRAHQCHKWLGPAECYPDWVS